MDRKPSPGTGDADLIIRAVLGWVRSQPDIRAVALVGSDSWAFRDHRTMVEVIADEAAAA
jgi:hypothetical protein